MATTLASLTGATTVIGGGDSVSAVNKMACRADVAYFNRRRASLELVEGKVLPGVKALMDR